MGLFHMEYIWNGLLLENDQVITSSTYYSISNVFHRVFPQIFVICLVTCLGFGKI